MLLGVLAAATACTIPDTTATVLVEGPDRAAFASVSPFLEGACGTLYCHGAPERPMRIEGFDGLRRSPTDTPGGNPTTPAEVEANYEAVCGLEPEVMQEVVAGAQPPDALLLVQKPRDETHHKGGAVIQKGDDGDECLVSWLEGHTDAAACSRAASMWRRQP